MDDPLDVLRSSERIAVVGASGTPGKEAHEIPRLMIDLGYEIVPVNPRLTSLFGRACYPTLAEVPGPIDLVNVFRPAEEAAGVARQAADAKAGALWLQTGIASAEAERIAREAGMRYVEDRCIRVIAGRLRYLGD